MKKIKINSLSIANKVSNSDKVLALISGELKKADKSLVTEYRKQRYIIPGLAEIDTNDRKTGLIGVLIASYGQFGLYIHATDTTVVLLNSTSPPMFSAGIGATVGLSLYQKTPGGNLFIRNNNSDSLTVDLIIY